MTASPISPIPRPGERVPLPAGLTRLADGSLRADGVDGVAVISPAAGAESRTVSVEAGLRVLEALGGTYLPTVGPTASSATTTATRSSGLRTAAFGDLDDSARGADRSPGGGAPAEPSDETTLLKPISLVTELPPDAVPTHPEPESAPGPDNDDAATVADGVGAAVGLDAGTGAAVGDEGSVAQPAPPSPGDSSPELLETGVWEDPDDASDPLGQSRGRDGADGADTGDVGTFPDYPEPEPGSGRRRRRGAPQ